MNYFCNLLYFREVAKSWCGALWTWSKWSRNM